MQRVIIWTIILGFIVIAGWSTFPKLIPHAPTDSGTPAKNGIQVSGN